MNFAASYVSRADLESYMLKHLKRSVRRKDDFKPYVEPFRPLNKEEIRSIRRDYSRRIETHGIGSDTLVSYQALTGGFTICNIIHNNRLFSGSSHCSKVDQWLPIRGQMLAFKRALESTGITLPVNLPNGESEF